MRLLLAGVDRRNLPLRRQQWLWDPRPRLLAVEGTMAIEERNGQSRSVVIAQRITPIARPKRPLEP